MIEIFHRICNRPAFLYDHQPVAGEPIRAKHARTLDGEPILSGTPMICGSCGWRILTPSHELRPSPIKTYDMTSQKDMQELYGTGGVDVHV